MKLEGYIIIDEITGEFLTAWPETWGSPEEEDLCNKIYGVQESAMFHSVDDAKKIIQTLTEELLEAGEDPEFTIEFTIWKVESWTVKKTQMVPIEIKED